MNHKYKFSVVIPVYNVEKYIAETLESLIHQTIGFKQNIQVILVNDGSTDRSGSVCQKYKELYPNNIIYTEKENGGVSSARNAGFPYIEGKYVNFLDSDDLWEKHTFARVYSFFEKHQDEIDVVSCRIKRFEAKDCFHSLDYKFTNGNRVIDILSTDSEKLVQLSAPSTFIKAQAVKENDGFPEYMSISEDTIYINNIILQKCKYGVMKSALYYYRSRLSDNSAIQRQHQSKAFYNKQPSDYFYGLITLSEKHCGKVIRYIQQLISYDIGWRTTIIPPSGLLTDDEKNKYYQLIKDVYTYIDDDIVVKHEVHQSILVKSFIYNLKTGGDFFANLTVDNEQNAVFFEDNFLIQLDTYRNGVEFNFIDIKNNTLHLEGFISKWLYEIGNKSAEIYLKCNKNKFKLNIEDYPHKLFETFCDKRTTHYRFQVDIDLTQINVSELRMVFNYNNREHILGLQYGKFIPNYNKFICSYKSIGKYIIKCYGSFIRIYAPAHLAVEKFICEAKANIWLTFAGHFSAAFWRIFYDLFHKLIKGQKELWIISDRDDKANDNGEQFFRYLNSIGNENIKCCFAINKSSPDEPRMRSIGKVLHFDSWIYPLYFLCADKIITSSAGEYSVNPFEVNKKYFVDKMNFKHIFLQHGITEHNLSAFLNKYNKNIHFLVAGTQFEYNAFCEKEYYYDKDVVNLTGFARYDKLVNNKEKLIVIMPTWRRSIKPSYDSHTQSIYFDGFKDTEYFKFYNRLINDERLLALMREKGYKGLFCTHPIHEKQWVDYTANDVFKINEGFVNYSDVFSRGALLITDYSSVAFDFAYLRKPVVYTQFDLTDFYNGQIYDKGYFSYADDGFGPVAYDYESSVNAIIDIIRNDCSLNDLYLKRIDNTFAFNDTNNCERIYNGILRMK